MTLAVHHTADRALLEASGTMTLERLPQVAATGVNLISMGALTHSAPAVDIHLRII
jgi:nicotinate-nucleotide pyrophosphorylase (carboxylating)